VPALAPYFLVHHVAVLEFHHVVMVMAPMLVPAMMARIGWLNTGDYETQYGKHGEQT